MPHWPAGVVIVLSACACVLTHRHGHDWGDDFALYVRQAEGLVNGSVAEVVADNRYTVANSSWHTFSPTVYPWGWPLLMAPFVAAFGRNYAVLKVLVTAMLMVFLVAYYRLMIARVDRWAGAVLVAFTGFSVSYISWTNSVVSDIPYLAAAGITLWWIDRNRRSGAPWAGSRRALTVAGLLIAAAYSIRREGLALASALAAVQLAELHTHRSPAGLMALLRTVPIRRWLRPYVVAVGAVLALHLVLPDVLAQRYPGTGLGRLWPNARWFAGPLAEQLGLRDMGASRRDLLGSAGLATGLFVAFLVLAGVGLVVRLMRHSAVDAGLVAFTVSSGLAVGVLPFSEGRYLFSITPFLVYFAVQALPRWSVGLAFVGVLAFANLTDTSARLRDAADRGDAAEWGPESVSSRQMFVAVRKLSRGDEIVAFWRARAMNLYADRQAIQLLSVEHLVERADWYVRVKDPDDYSQVPLSAEEAARLGIRLAWENRDFEIWELPGR